MPLQARANLLALIESTQDHVWSVDLEYRLTTFNRAFQQHIESNFGVKMAVGMRLHEELPSARAVLWPPLYERALSQGPFRTEYVLGTGSTVEFSFNPIADDGKVIGISVFGKDITERKQAQSDLGESEQRFRTMADGSPVPMWVTDEWGSTQFVNRACVEFFGESARSNLGDNWAALVYPDDLPAYADSFNSAVRSNAPMESEARLRRTDGEWRWCRSYAAPRFSPSGAFMGHVGLSIDITEHKLATQALAENETRFRRFFEENASLMLLVEPATGEIVSANRAAASYFGLPKEQLVGILTPQYNLMPAEQFALNRQIVMRGERTGFTYRIRLASGEERDIEAYSSPFEVGGRMLLFAIGHDVTERRLAEAHLHDSEERFRATFEQAPVGIVHVSFEGTILRCNARFAQIIGYPAEEVPGLTVKQITAPGELILGMESMERISSGVDGETIEKRYIRKDGSLLWARTTVAVQRDGEGRPLHYTSFVEDINAQKEAEKLLAEASQAMQVSEERYRTVFETSPDAVMITRMSDGVILDVNQSALDSAGFDRGEVTGRTASELGAWVNDRDKQTFVDTLLRDSRCREMEVESRRKNGETFWMRLSASLIEIGGCQCGITFAHDISNSKAAAEALRLSEERYRLAFQLNFDSIDICHLEDGRFIDVNEAFLRNTGFKREEVIGRTSLELGLWDDPFDRQKLVERINANSVCQNFEVAYRNSSGALRWGLQSVSAIEMNGVPCILSVTRDITDAKAAHDRLAAATGALRLSEQRYRTVFQTSLDAISIARLSDMMFIDVNQSLLDTLGYERDEVIGKTSQELGFWADERDRLALMEAVSRNSGCSGLEARLRKKNGEVGWGEISASIIEIDGLPCVLSITRDISAAKAAESTIRSLALYDPLTGLPNRRQLLEKLRQPSAAAGPKGRSTAILLIDLDHFKTFNDTLGHQSGDLLLKEVVRRIVACMHEGELVCRLGGDEFVVMIESLSGVAEEAAAEAKAAGEQILTAIDRPYSIESREYLLTASIGISIFGDRQKSADDVLQQADIAMDQSKAAGRNTVRFFSPALQAAVNARATMELELRQAIKTNQFLLYYQAQVEGGRVTGAEALIRWNHPTRGLVMPDAFISLAEESRLILPIGNWVLETACAQVAAWAGQELTSSLSLAVNISALQFRQPEFVYQVLAALSRTGANPKNIRLELTESMLVDDIEDVIAKMTELRAHGLRFSLDDFGTGYSSLSYLKRLSLDRLKIDRSFVRDILEDSTSGAIAQTILSLGKAMGLSVIAEGVETEEQRSFLAGLGCDSYQGYLFSRPVPLEQFEPLLHL